jgi:hypothetical protein
LVCFCGVVFVDSKYIDLSLPPLTPAVTRGEP